MSNFSVKIAGKRIELLKEWLPALARIAVWHNAEAAGADTVELAAVKQAVNGVGIECLAIDARTPAGYDGAAAATREWAGQALYITSNPTAYANRTRSSALRRQRNCRPCTFMPVLSPMAA